MKRHCSPALLKLAFIFMISLLPVIARAATYSPGDVPNVHVDDRTQFVANPDGILSKQAVARLNLLMQRMRRELSIEPMVVAVDDIDNPSDYQDFATELFELWGLGKADVDNGLLLLIVKDRQEVAIRPGYGLEGALPDITIGRILREEFAPAARAENLDQAAIASMEAMERILSDPNVAEEYRSSQQDVDEAADDDPAEDAFGHYVLIMSVVALVMLLILLIRIWTLRGRSDYDKYRALAPWKSVYLILTAAGIFIPLVASVPLILCLNRWRNRPRKCPKCATAMTKVDEVHDNDYLTPAQDLEERIGSVDYDVWLCPECGETDILAYVLPSSTYTECENCHARTMRPTGYRVVKRPTSVNHGVALKDYECLNCHHRRQDKIDLPPDQTRNVAGAAAAGAILGGRGGFGGGIGGGRIGGGFGGGRTGGGGAGIRW